MCLSMSQGRIKLPQQQRQQRQEEDEEFKRKQTTFLFKHNEIVIYSFISLWSFRLHTVVVIIIIRVLQEQLRRQSVSQVIVIGPAIMGLHKRLKLLLLLLMAWLIHPTPSHPIPRQAILLIVFIYFIIFISSHTKFFITLRILTHLFECIKMCNL